MFQKCKPVLISTVLRLTKMQLYECKGIKGDKDCLVSYHSKKWRSKFAIDSLFIIFLTKRIGRNHTCRNLFTACSNVLCKNFLNQNGPHKQVFIARYSLKNIYPQCHFKCQFTKDHQGKKLTFLFIQTEMFGPMWYF